MNNLKKAQHLSSLPESVWPVECLANLEREAAKAQRITLYRLMENAGEAVFRRVSARWPEKKHWLILCGAGNNGGDGFVIAQRAQAAGLIVTVIACPGKWPPEAAQARGAWLESGGVIHEPADQWPESVDVIIDALFGTGLNRAPQAPYSDLIDEANAHPAPVFSVDVPSGLNAATGAVPGAVIMADETLTFLVLKPGLLTGKARDVTGRLFCDDLGIGAGENAVAPIQRCDAASLRHWLKPLRRSAHKGDNGKLVIVGGDTDTAGAVRMAGEAALRSGAGLVRILTRPENSLAILAARPELMVGALTDASLSEAMEWADAMVIGPGLGQSEWSKNALKMAENFRKPMLWDADALNLLAQSHHFAENRLLTPHPGEAARLLSTSVAEIENNRPAAARQLAQKFGGTVVLKGAGTLIVSAAGEMAIADVGNPGMASGGMGDVLSGIIGCLLGQGHTLFEAACAGSVIHGAAADVLAARRGPRGMLATDLFSELYAFINPEM
ncbi:MAG: Bifunctional NAD(P)H-hydrate repair enzyme Nnr [Candidatus Erwinia impunctatus]|nr:Bifunctional NAD(P)H-hydrate repair enzyme Nnr [Culicoides impunctatus]